MCPCLVVFFDEKVVSLLPQKNQLQIVFYGKEETKEAAGSAVPLAQEICQGEGAYVGNR